MDQAERRRLLLDLWAEELEALKTEADNASTEAAEARTKAKELEDEIEILSGKLTQLGLDVELTKEQAERREADAVRALERSEMLSEMLSEFRAQLPEVIPLPVERGASPSEAIDLAIDERQEAEWAAEETPEVEEVEEVEEEAPEVEEPDPLDEWPYETIGSAAIALLPPGRGNYTAAQIAQYLRKRAPAEWLRSRTTAKRLNNLVRNALQRAADAGFVTARRAAGGRGVVFEREATCVVDGHTWIRGDGRRGRFVCLMCGVAVRAICSTEGCKNPAPRDGGSCPTCANRAKLELVSG